MKKPKAFILVLIIAAIAGGVFYATRPPSGQIVLTGIVTTDEVTVSPQVRGLLQQLLVKQGDNVKSGQLLAVIQPEEQLADVAYYEGNHQQSAAQVAQAQADLEFAQLTLQRDVILSKTKAVSDQDFDQARTNYASAKARVDAMAKQNEAAGAQKDKAMVQLGYTKIVAPVDAIVDTRAALQGEVVNIGQPIVTLIDQDDLWVRADVEETFIDRIHLGQKLQVKLPSGAVRDGTVFYRGVDADYATQRDVSRTKRDIRTFEIRLRCDNSDRALAVGMTAYVTLPLDASPDMPPNSPSIPSASQPAVAPTEPKP
jgi:RND family efflux transporter MFP subunit